MHIVHDTTALVNGHAVVSDWQQGSAGAEVPRPQDRRAGSPQSHPQSKAVSQASTG